MPQSVHLSTFFCIFVSLSGTNLVATISPMVGHNKIIIKLKTWKEKI